MGSDVLASSVPFSVSPLVSHILLQSLAMLLTAWVIPGLSITNIFGAVVTVLALSAINASIWDAALFFSIPYSLSSHTLLLLLMNGFIFWLLVKLLPGIEVSGILPAIAAPVVFTIFSVFITAYGRDVDWVGLLNRGLEIVREIKSYFQQSATPEAVN